MIRDGVTFDELVAFLRVHPHVETVPAGVQGGLFGGDVEMVRCVVGRIGVLVSLEDLTRARDVLRTEGREVMAQSSLLAGSDWSPV